MEENKLEKKKINCEIVEPSIDLKESFLSALEEYKKEGRSLDEGITDPGVNFASFIQHFKDESLGVNMKPGRVPQTTFWITDKDGYAGRISIRHELNDYLLKFGGHIGYGVRPSKRGLGYASKALELALPKARALGLKKVLITCDSTNEISRKIIEKAGGVLENEVFETEGKPTKLRFWIQL
ncbi:MAG: GNAT family N-acetyltransferase [Candidatus Paceibacterota bacterium]|jgi:predicted acetyltransferase